MSQKDRVSYPKLSQYKHVLCVNSRSTTSYRWMKDDILKAVSAVAMDFVFVGFYLTKKTRHVVTVIAFNDEYIPHILEGVIHKYVWFDTIWTSDEEIDVNEFAHDHFVEFDPEVLVPIPAAKSKKSKIVISTGRLIRYDATDEEIAGKTPELVGV